MRSFLSLVAGVLCAVLAPALRGHDAIAGAAPPVEIGLGGLGGVHFLATPGELIVDVEKRDRNLRSHPSCLRLLLVSPDRRVLQDVTIPDGGPPQGRSLGPPQRVRLSTAVPRQGVYALVVTVPDDPYGGHVVWGFATNCRKYVIETARGHRDAPHEEPIVLHRPGQPGDVCFLPRQGRFAIEVSRLPAGVKTLAVFDAEGTRVQEIAVDGNRQARHTFPADPRRGARPWRLHLPAQEAVIHIDGVTRWKSNDVYPHLACWTPRLDAFFPIQACRWLLTPYSRTVYARPGESGEVRFQVHNNLTRARTVRLRIERPDGPSWPVRLSSESLEVGPDSSAAVIASFSVPPDAQAEGETRACHIRATPSDDDGYSTYATLIVKTGVAPFTRALPGPLVLRPFQHENEQFGYIPDYPTGGQVYFDLNNQPFVRGEGRLWTAREGAWTSTPLPAGVSEAESTKIAFDGDNGLYLIASRGAGPVLLHSADGGRSFSECPLKGPHAGPSLFDIEQFSGHNRPAGPPPILRYTLTARDPRMFWHRVNTLELLLPAKRDGKLVIGEPVLISRRCIGQSAHSGIPSSVVSCRSKVHMIWGEATARNERDRGLPTYVATYDRQTGRLSDPVLVGHGAPANDVHNSPSITVDSRGYLHALTGAHGRPFQYARSRQPNDAHGGWTRPVSLDPALSSTYVGLVCGPDDTLHLVFRNVRSDGVHHPLGSYATLAYMRKRAGGEWEKERPLVVAPLGDYSIFYHRLTVDRLGRLFLSYDCWSTYWFYRNDHFGNRRTLMMSDSGGDSWRLAQTADILAARRR
jgi:hypothetical protein